MAIVVNVILLYLVNVTPGWRELPFLTEDFVGVLWLVNLSMVTSAVANAAYLGYDPPWFMSVCQIGISATGLAAANRGVRAGASAQSPDGKDGQLRGSGS